jgi:Fe-Mn family superoxide dismutase
MVAPPPSGLMAWIMLHQTKTDGAMKKFELAKLTYEYSELEPVISEKTLHFHHDKHHQGYVDHLNKLLIGSEFAGDSLEEIVLKSDGPLFDNAAQSWNHDFYWKCMGPQKDTRQPDGNLLQALEGTFETMDKFKSEFQKKGESFFGVGWLWLVSNPKGVLSLVTTRDAKNPLRDGLNPILVCDLWEHAYYLDYQNLRSKYLNSFFDIINWNFATSEYDRVVKSNDADSIKNKVRLAS